jgi:citrate lyase beta subunit
MNRTTFTPEETSPLLRSLALAARPPAPPATRQPVHTVYGGAHLFESDTAHKIGRLSRRALDENAPDPETFGRAMGVPDALAAEVYRRVRDKLALEPVEDYRIDFEDGFGYRPDDEEDHHAVRTAEALARGLEAQTLPPFVGLRVKSLGGEMRARAVRTLDLFVTTLAERTGGRIPPGFRVTLPKVESVAEVAGLEELCDVLEARLGLRSGALSIELMVETPHALFDPEGRAALPRLVSAAGRRCVAAHFGPYDYTAALDVTAASQRLAHPACDFARQVMQATLAGTRVALSDGPTNTMPIGPHRGAELTPGQRDENRVVVHQAWRLHATNVRRALDEGFYQGWDLHPAQLPARYAAVYAFFLEGLPAATARLRRFVDQAAQATRLGDVFDDAATGQGLLNYFLRGLACGALTEPEALATGLTLDELRTRSFVRILDARR